MADGRLLHCLLNGTLAGMHDAEPVWNTTPALYPEYLLRALSTQSTYFKCVDDGNTAGLGWEGIFINRSEWFAQTPSGITNAKIAGLVGISAHELTHTAGYSDGPENNGANHYENPFIMVSQMATCASNIHHDFNLDAGNGAMRDFEMAATGDTMLAAFGAFGGGPNPQLQCGTTDFARGLRGRAGGSIDALGLQCTSSATPIQGGSGGGSFALNCLSGEVLVGVHGRADGVVDRIGPVCGLASDVMAGIHSDFGDDPSVGGGNPGHYFRRTCPAGHAVKGLRMRTGALVDRVELICQRMSSPRAIALQALTPTSGTGGGTTRVETCPSRSAMFQIVPTTHPAHGVGRITGACRPISNSAQNGAITVQPVPEYTHLVPGAGAVAGGDDYEHFVDDCRGVLVGISVRTDGWVRQIRGECIGANEARLWSQGDALTPVIAGTQWRGSPTGAPIETRRCPLRHFMVGYSVRSGDFVDSIEVLCRRF